MITWLASYPKSGNTWVRLMFNALFSGGHIDINKPYWGKSDNDPYVYNSLSPKNYSDLNEKEVLMLRSAALLHLCEMAGQTPLLVKTHHCYGAIEGIPLFPKPISTNAFYIARDPREVAPSMAVHYNKDLDWVIDKMADKEAIIADKPQTFSFLSSWSEHTRTWCSQKDFPSYVVLYHQLKKDPEGMLVKMLGLLGLKARDEQIKAAIDATNLAKLRSQEKKVGFNENPGKELFFGGKRPRLTYAQCLRIENDHGEMMEKIGVK